MSDMNKPYEEEVDLQEIGEDINETPEELIDSENINNDEENVEDEEIVEEDGDDETENIANLMEQIDGIENKKDSEELVKLP